MKIQKKVVVAALALGAFASSLAGAQTSASRLEMVKKRGKLICGTHNAKPGFGSLSSRGVYEGFDTDFCRAMAAAVFGDPTKVEFVPLTSAARFPAVQSGEVDVVFRSTTLTSTRDAGADFGPVLFYDGQGVMVKANAPVKRIADLDGATVCATQGSTTEQNITDFMRKNRKQIKLVTYQDFDKVMAAFEQGRCDAFTTDVSVLASRKATAPNPKAYRILPEIISKEPLAPFVAQGDSQWKDIMTWVHYAPIYAEELGITSANVDGLKTSTDPTIRRFLGVEGDTGKLLGLNPDFAAAVVRAVGNYAEIYNRHLGPQTAFNLPRGLNRLYTKGGILYSPPFR